MSKQKYIETEYSRIPFYRSWWTFGWGLFSPGRMSDLISAIKGDQSAATNKRHMLSNLQHAYNTLHERYKELNKEVEELRAKAYFVPPEGVHPGQTWEDVCKEHMDVIDTNKAVLLHMKTVLKGTGDLLKMMAVKAQKAGTPYKWMQVTAKDIDEALEDLN